MPFAFNLYLHGLTLTFWLHFGYFFFKAVFRICFLLIDLFTVFVWFCNFSSLIRVFSELTWLVVKMTPPKIILRLLVFRTMGRLSCFVHIVLHFELFLRRFFFLMKCKMATLCGSFFLTYLLSPYLSHKYVLGIIYSLAPFKARTKNE